MFSRIYAFYEEQGDIIVYITNAYIMGWHEKQESPAIADKPTRRESLPKIVPIRRAYNIVADNTGLSSCV